MITGHFVTPILTRKAMEILERFDIADDANQKVGALAQGVRKFADIAKDHLWKCTETAHVMVVTDPGIVRLGLEKDMITNLKQSGVKVLLFDAVESDPSPTTILCAVLQAKFTIKPYKRTMHSSS